MAKDKKQKKPKTFPKDAWVSRDANGYLNVWDSLDDAEGELVAYYILDAEYEKRTVSEIRCKGSKGWNRQ